ncbi:MAG: response regulator [bacterium]|nr:response regulator [bacterium]
MSTILIIDSAETFARYVELVVGRYGCRTIGVKSAQEALKVLSDGAVDLVIAQENLPDMEWPEFCRRIREGSDPSRVPVIMLSAEPARTGSSECGGVVVAEVRTKPISIGDLIDVLSEYLPLQNKRRTLRAAVALRALIRIGSELIPCQVLNLSEGGVFVLRNQPGEVGDDVTLILPLPGLEKPVKVAGKVAYVIRKSTEKKPRGMGVQFETVPDETTELLQAYLEDQVATILGR